MKIWESKDKKCYIQIKFGSADLDPEAQVTGTNNCGVGVLTGLTLTLTAVGDWGATSLPLLRPKPATLTEEYKRQYKQVYGTDAPCPARQWDENKKKYSIPTFTAAELYNMVLEKFVDFVKGETGQGVRYGMYLLSNRVVDGDDTVFNQGDYPFSGRGTAWLMKLIRDTKCGTLITSPVVENITHPGQSGIMVGMWIPPTANVLYNKVGISKGFDESRLPEIAKAKPLLAAGTPKFVEYFYGRKSVAHRLESKNGNGRGITAGAAAAR